MGKCLLSIDWDYFVYPLDTGDTHLENSRNLLDLWYKKYLQARVRGKDLQEAYRLSAELDTFWGKIKKYFKFAEYLKAYVTDSHTLAYEIAKANNCTKVYLFDAHADLGYGGLSSLDFEVNCSNWLGKLLQEGQVTEANIFYSPHTREKPELFDQLNSIYNIKYCDFHNFAGGVEVAVMHVCRSGAWTPPWLDLAFQQFVDGMGVPYETVECPQRKWNPDHLSFSEQIDYLLA